SDGLRLIKLFAQIKDLLALWGNDANWKPGRSQSHADRSKGVALACPGAPAEQGDEVTGAQNLLRCLALVSLQCWISAAFSTESLVLASAFTRHANDLPFPTESLACCDLSRSVFIAEVIPITACDLHVFKRELRSACVL